MSNDATLPAALDPDATRTFIDACWEDEIVPQLIEYIRIPNKSPLFDPDWDAHGHMEQATQLIADWCRTRPVEGLQLEIVRLPGRTPLIWMEIPGSGEGTVLLYGHLDKQPEMVGWREGLGPWIPVREGDRLFGRGGADDGYAAFASLTAIEALQRQGVPHARCIVLIEACEESGSPDLPFYIEHLADRIGEPDLVICLDSGCGNYDQLWLTTSLRGIVVGTLRVEILREGVHSGDASGVVPSSFRIARQLLSRIENPETGLIDDPAFTVDIPPERRAQAEQAGAVLGNEVHGKFPFVEGAGPTHEDPTELVLRRTWRAALSVTGQDGMPALADAGNVLRPQTSLKLSLRVPPTTSTVSAGQRLKALLERDPPYGAHVSFELSMPGDGWNAPPLAPWLEQAVSDASERHFGQPAVQMGEGGSIPFMGMLGERFPQAQFLITGVLGPGSNAHGPNEFLDIPTGKRLTACVADVLAVHRALSE
jgi:acetylornithine deacetylase/succinyl-diaminopimelate desuccinylase-like protein